MELKKQYTVDEVKGLVEVEQMQIAAGATERMLRPVVETLKGVEELLVQLPAHERVEAGGEWIAVGRNCRSQVGVAVDSEGLVSFAVEVGEKRETFFSARQAVREAAGQQVTRLPRAERHQEVPLSPQEVELAAAADPAKGVDFAHRRGEFGGGGDLAAEGLTPSAEISLDWSWQQLQDEAEQDRIAVPFREFCTARIRSGEAFPVGLYRQLESDGQAGPGGYPSQRVRRFAGRRHD